MDAQARRAFVAARLDEVGLDPACAEAWPHVLSGGQQRRAALAMALATDPALLVADEPTANLDPLRRCEVVSLLRSLRARRGSALLLISHDLRLAAALCPAVAVMFEGRLVHQGEWATLEDDSVHPYVARWIGAQADRVSISGQGPAHANGCAAPNE